jgi:hypothetical protein
MRICNVLCLSLFLSIYQNPGGKNSAAAADVDSIVCWKENQAMATNVSSNMLRRFRAEVVGSSALSGVELIKPGQVLGTSMSLRVIGAGKVMFDTDSSFQNPIITDGNYPDGTYTFRAISDSATYNSSASIAGAYPPFPSITSPSSGEVLGGGPYTVHWTLPVGSPDGYIVSGRNLTNQTEFSETISDPGATSRTLPNGFLGQGETVIVTVTSCNVEDSPPVGRGEKRVSNFVQFSAAGPTPTFTSTFTPTITPTPTPTGTPTNTPTITLTPSVTPTNATPIPTETPGPTMTPTLTPIYIYADANRDGIVDQEDLFILMSEWGKEGTPWVGERRQ